MVNVKCGRCRHLHSAKKWGCVCRQRWHICPQHSKVGKLCGVPLHSKTARAVKRPSSIPLDAEGYPLPCTRQRHSSTSIIVSYEEPPALHKRLFQEERPTALGDPHGPSSSSAGLARPPLPWPRPQDGRSLPPLPPPPPRRARKRKDQKEHYEALAAIKRMREARLG